MPRPTDPPWELAQFISVPRPLPRLKLHQEGWKEQAHSSVLRAKDLITGFESQEQWEIRKKITNPYEAIFSSNEERSFPSLALVQPLSRSYFKMVEMLHVLDFWTGVNTPLVTAHVCEGPGGFIQCTLQQAKQRGIPVKSVAMTLKPTKSHIPGWRRSIGFLRKNPEVLLEYGDDQSGDVLLPQNQAAFTRRIMSQDPKGAALFTADGGFDFSVDYSKQEVHAFPLLLASFIMGLQCLRPGGTMIIKLFDIYSEATQDLFLGTAALFARFTLYKPATSRPCNSERYFLASGYLGASNLCSSTWIAHLQTAATTHARSPLTRMVDAPTGQIQAWAPALLAAVQEQIRYQEALQIQSIHDTIHLDKSTIEERIKESLLVSQEWCKTFNVPCASASS
jgi:cap2 methyltransferase